MYPAASRKRFLLFASRIKIFSRGKIDSRQIEDYSRRKGMDLRLVGAWLSPNLNYDPDTS